MIVSVVVGGEQLGQLSDKDLTAIMLALQPLQKHFHQYLLIGGFPEVAKTNDIPFAQKIIREDVVIKLLSVILSLYLISVMYPNSKRFSCIYV